MICAGCLRNWRSCFGRHDHRSEYQRVHRPGGDHDGDRSDTRKAISMFDDYYLGERSMTVNLTTPRMTRASGRPH